MGAGSGDYNFLEKGGVQTLPSLILSKIVYWIFIVFFLSYGLNFAGISQFSEYASRISATLPIVIVSFVIVIVGIIFSNFISRVIYLGCENARFQYGDFIAKGVRILLIVIIFGIVFEYIGLGNTIITISFLIVFGGYCASSLPCPWYWFKQCCRGPDQREIQINGRA